MNRSHIVALTTGSLVLAACYTLTSVTTLQWDSPAWTGSGRYGVSGPHRAVGLAGQDVYFFDGSSSVTRRTAPLLSQFGDAYTLTSAAQTSSLGHHERSFAHGNLVGRTDNLRLLYTEQSHFGSMDWVEPWSPTFYDRSNRWRVVQICDMTASETHDFVAPHEPDSHLFLSIRACPLSGSGSCAGGVIEAAFGPNMDHWWVRSNQDGWQGTITKPDGGLYSNECMPISVTTTHGDQQTQLLVVGDPSWDELTVYDASRLWDAPLDHRRVSTGGRNIADVAVEGRRDGSVEYGFLAVLWTGYAGAQLQHTTIVNGEFPSGPPHLIESIDNDTQFIESLGYGAETNWGYLFSFGERAQRRLYEQ